MSESKPVMMPTHLWEAVELMSIEMGVPADALIAQAVFTLARLNGYVVAGRALEGADAAASHAPAPPPPKIAPAAVSPKEKPPGVRARQAPPPEPEPEPELPEDEGNPFDDPAPEENYDEQYDAPPEEPEPQYDEPEPEPEPPPPPPSRSRGASLTLFVAGRDPFKMVGDSFNIGRGKTCDFVIDSNRVSREHVRISREGSDFVLEDLNSSNGTFFGPAKEKITKRKIKDGDEFTLGTEKIKFQIRK